MSEDPLIARLPRRTWLVDGPLSLVVSAYPDYLRVQGYTDSTIRAYLSALAHFSYWLKLKGANTTKIDEAMVELFLSGHIPSCTCPSPRYCYMLSLRAALRHLMVVLHQEGLGCPQPSKRTPIFRESELFLHYLRDTCGLAQSTCNSRVKHVHTLLTQCFGAGEVDRSKITAHDIEACLSEYAKRWKPVSLSVIRTSLKSYLRFRTLLGDQTQSLEAALPLIADLSHTNLPKSLSEEQIDRLLQAFDLNKPTGLRDYGITRCLVDLGLRGHEVARLSLESVDWSSGVLTITHSKSVRVQQLPLPHQTGKAIAQYLHRGRPTTSNRYLFVRHCAPINKPLSVSAIRSIIFRAFRRCGLDEHLYRSHVLRHTLAIRLQQSGASLKEIADTLRHKNLQTTTVYAKVDLEGLRTVALPWPGRQP